MQSKTIRKVFSVILSLSLILQLGIPVVYAEGQEKTITSFDELPEGQKGITVAVGATEEEVFEELPDTLAATCQQTTTGGAISVTLEGITWDSDQPFFTEIEGEFVFTAKLADEGYTFAEDVVMPQITVLVIDQSFTVMNSPPEWPDGMDQVDGASYGGEITQAGFSLKEDLKPGKWQYKAYEGYVLITSEEGKCTIELNNAALGKAHTSETPTLDLTYEGDLELTLDIVGENVILSRFGDIAIGANKLILTGDGDLELEDVMMYKEELNIDDFKGTLKGIVFKTEGEQTIEVFGDVTLINGFFFEKTKNADLIIPQGSKLTLNNDRAEGSTSLFSLNGTLVLGEDTKLLIKGNVTLIMSSEGTSSKMTNDGGSIIVEGDLRFANTGYLQYIPEMNIVTQGEGKVYLGSPYEYSPIDPTSGKLTFDPRKGQSFGKGNGGEYICGNGKVIWEPVLELGNLIGGTITLNNVDIKAEDEDASTFIDVMPMDEEGTSIPITLNIIGNNTIEHIGGMGIGGFISNLTLTGSGTLNAKNIGAINYRDSFDMTGFTGELNAVVHHHERTDYGINNNLTVYGTVSYSGDIGKYPRVSVADGAELTMEEGSALYASEFTNKGRVINNGMLCLARVVNDKEELKDWVYHSLNLEGNGMVKVHEFSYEHPYSYGVHFTNTGKLMHELNTPLDFSNPEQAEGNLAQDGYKWDKENNKLTIQSLIMEGGQESEAIPAIKLPEGKDVTLELKGYNKIIGFQSAINQGSINKYGAMVDPPKAQGSLTICGDGVLITEKQTYNQENNEDILTTTGKLIVENGNIIMISKAKNGIAAAGIEIKEGNIGLKNMSAPIYSYGDFKMSGGKVISGDGDSGSLAVAGNLTLSGGELITGDAMSSIFVINGNVTISGGRLFAHKNRDMAIGGISIQITGDEDKTISIIGGTVDIEVGMAALLFQAMPGAKGKGIFETKGMTITTDPKGGTLKSTTIGLADEEEVATIYALTASENLEIGGMMLSNASTSLKAVKAPTKPSDNDDSSSGGSSGGGNATITRPDTAKPNAPTTATTLVKANVTNGTSNVIVSQSTVADAIAKAQAEAKKNDREANGIAVEIKVDTKNSTASNVSANLPKETVDALTKAGVKELSINSDIGIISLDLETLKTIQNEINSDLTVSVKRVDSNTLSEEAKAVVGDRPVYDFTITGTNGTKVTSFGKGKVSISIPYTLGKDKKAENVLAYFIDDEGKPHEIADSVYDEKTGILFFVTDYFSIFAVGYKEDEQLEDVDDLGKITFTDITNHWAKKDIEFVTARGLFEGTAEGVFSPNMSMTRGMLVTVLGRLDKVDLSSYTTSRFTDVKSDAYYMSAIEWAKENGIVSGISASEFAPNQAITREQLAVIIANYAKANGFELPGLQIENSFADHEKISDYAKVAVKQMQRAGIIAGREDNTFDPKGTATRAEVSAVLKRLIELIEEK